MRGKAQRERKEKAAKRKETVEGFRALLGELEGELTAESTMASVAASKGLDPRFVALELKDREALLAQAVKVSTHTHTHTHHPTPPPPSTTWFLGMALTDCL